MLSREPAILVLEDGRRFRGRAYGARGRTFGEAVFATGMTGYQETITDPSYAGQIVLQTAPQASYTLAFTGGDERTRYLLSGSYFDQSGIVIGSVWNYALSSRFVWGRFR